VKFWEINTIVLISYKFSLMISN